ncbi:Acetyltransferase (GNAT) family protein [compost metagenome]
MIFREANINDIEGLSSVRMSVHENVLNNPVLVTHQDYTNYLTTHGKGWLCEINNEIVGFAIVDTMENNIWALFVNPDHDKKGIGKELHRLMMNWYFSQCEETVWLGTSPHTRAAEFYTRQGWTAVGMHGKEIKFEMTKSEWTDIN